jgi:hypothetical protein
MNLAIAIRKTPDGRIQARRIDGKPLSAADREEARRMSLIAEIPARAWVVEEVRDNGKLRAVKICSAVLQDHLWVLMDRSFESKDELAVYYSEELPELKTKTTEQLREIHNFKLTFPRCRLIQEGAQVDERLE